MDIIVYPTLHTAHQSIIFGSFWIYSRYPGSQKAMQISNFPQLRIFPFGTRWKSQKSMHIPRSPAHSSTSLWTVRVRSSISIRLLIVFRMRFSKLEYSSVLYAMLKGNSAGLLKLHVGIPQVERSGMHATAAFSNNCLLEGYGIDQSQFDLRNPCGSSNDYRAEIGYILSLEASTLKSSIWMYFGPFKCNVGFCRALFWLLGQVH